MKSGEDEPPFEPRPRDVRSSVRPTAALLKERLTEHLGEARQGLLEIRVAPPVVRPPKHAHLRRFLYGFGLPLRILRALFADHATRRHYLRVIFTQLAIIIAVGAVATLLGRAGDAFRGGAHDFRTFVAILSAFYAGLGIVEWIVVALSRDYHDQLGRRASLLSGAPPEDPEETPRIRVDIRWLGRKLKRKLRGAVVIAVGLPIVFLVSLIPFAGKFLYPLLAFAWTTYWIGVFTASRSSFAWRSEGVPDAKDPWFMRYAERLTKDKVISRFGLPRLYVIVWRNISSGVFPPAREFEDHPYELLGIAAFRTLLAIPGTYLFFRPILPVASAHVLCSPMPSEEGTHVEPSDTTAPNTTTMPLLTESNSISSAHVTKLENETRATAGEQAEESPTQERLPR